MPSDVAIRMSPDASPVRLPSEHENDRSVDRWSEALSCVGQREAANLTDLSGTDSRRCPRPSLTFFGSPVQFLHPETPPRAATKLALLSAGLDVQNISLTAQDRANRPSALAALQCVTA